MRVDWNTQPLGEIPDTHIARCLGVAVATVCIARNKRGIPPAPYSARKEPRRPKRSKKRKPSPLRIPHRTWWRLRRILRLSECPSCGATAGTPCVNRRSGKPYRSFVHQPRANAAGEADWRE